MNKDRNQFHRLGNRRVHQKVRSDGVEGIENNENDLYFVAKSFELPIRIQSHGSRFSSGEILQGNDETIKGSLRLRRCEKLDGRDECDTETMKQSFLEARCRKRRQDTNVTAILVTI